MRLRQCLIFLFCLKLNKLDVFFCSVYLSNTQCVYLSLQVWRFVFCSVYLSNTQSVNLSLQVWRFQSCCNLTFLLLVFVNSRIAHICHPCFKQHFTPLFLINNNFVADVDITFEEIISRRALTDDSCVAKSLS